MSDTYRPMLLPFEQQLPPGVSADELVDWLPPRHLSRRTNQSPKSRLLAICPQGHGLTARNSLAQDDGSRICLLCQKSK